MRAGLLNKIITVKEPIEVGDGYGGSNITYKDKFTTKARVEFNSQDREQVNDSIFYPHGYTFTIRHYHQIDENMIIEYKGKLYNIISVDVSSDDKIVIDTNLRNE